MSSFNYVHKKYHSQMVDNLRTQLTEVKEAWREWSQRLTGLVGPAYTDADLRKAADIKMAQDREELMTTIRHMRDKLTRIADLCFTNLTPKQQEIMAVVMEKLPPYDPLNVEIQRAAQLQEIDDLLQEHGLWEGGRLDSIKKLIKDNDGMIAVLKNTSEWIRRNADDIHSIAEVLDR